MDFTSENLVHQRKGREVKRSREVETEKPILNASVKEIHLFLAILALRFLSVVLVQTYFAPDEYWQSVEVAHNLVYGYGFLTWEWKLGLRSYLHPLSIAALYWIINSVGLDNNVELLIILPRIVQAIASAGSEILFYRFTRKHFGHRTALWITFSLCVSWIWFYCASRTLMNTVETCFACVAFYFFPWDLNVSEKEVKKSITLFTVVAALSVMLRPTSLAMWAPLYIGLFLNFSSIFRKTVELVAWVTLVSVLVLIASTIIDRLLYGRWVLVHFNFLHFNVITGQGTYFGREPWHWYFTEGIPVASATQLPFLFHGVYALFKRSSILAGFPVPDLGRNVLQLLFASMFVTVIMYTIPGHKEHRYLLNVVPIFCIFSGISLSSLSSYYKKLSVIWLLLTSILMCLYFGMVHQSGPLPVMKFLRSNVSPTDILKTSEAHFAFFLMPCHSTPYYSHLHYNVSMRLLTCHPDLEAYGKRHYLDETNLFYSNPTQWLNDNIFHKYQPVSNGKQTCSNILPKHFILYDTLYSEIHQMFDNCYEKCFETFHTHFPEGRMGGKIVVLCNMKN